MPDSGLLTALVGSMSNWNDNGAGCDQGRTYPHAFEWGDRTRHMCVFEIRTYMKSWGLTSKLT